MACSVCGEKTVTRYVQYKCTFGSVIGEVCITCADAYNQIFHESHPWKSVKWGKNPLVYTCAQARRLLEAGERKWAAHQDGKAHETTT